MADGFAREAAAFVASYDEIGLEKKTEWHLPEKDTPEWRLVRRAIGQAEFLSVQRTSPFLDFTLPRLLVIDFADVFLRWCADPSRPRWVELFNARQELENFFHD